MSLVPNDDPDELEISNAHPRSPFTAEQLAGFEVRLAALEESLARASHHFEVVAFDYVVIEEEPTSDDGRDR